MLKYLHFFNISAKQSFSNKNALFGTCFFLLILLFVYNRLWSVIGFGEQNINLSTNFIWYLLFAEMIILSSPRPERTIEEDIKSGNLAYYINKPISFFMMRFSESLGAMSVSFFSMGVFGSIATLLLTNSTSFELKFLPFIIIMAYISSIINVLFFTAVGFCALWLESIRTLSMALQRFAFIFGGAIFPLTIYPDWFVDIAKFTPFYAFYYLSIRLVYDFSWANLFEALLLSLFWVSLIASFIFIAYKHLNKKVDIYGG